MKRRQFIAASAAFGAVGLPFKTIAQVTLGTGTLTTVSDGTLSLPFNLPENVPSDELAALVDRFSLQDGVATERPLNVTLWQNGDRVVLFDAGSGPVFVDSAGALLENLDAAGVGADAITDVVFTHAHPDHIWGILDDFDEVPFPNAQLWIGQAEYDYWMDPATVESLDEARKFFAVGAQNRLEAITDGLQFFGDGEEVIPGITARLTPGHTPGHMSFVVSGGDGEAMVLGDAITNAHLQFARPDWPSANDHDPAQAGDTRAAPMQELAGSGMMIIGYHLPGDGIGSVQAEGDGYVFVPA